MSQPSSIDILTPFDPTAYTSISGAQLEQFGSGITPYTDKGFVVVSSDIGGVPQVPNANTVTKWQNYIWIRQSASTVSVYAWGQNVASDATFLQWISVNVAGIGVGSITGAQIAFNTITPNNISSVNWSQISGAPTSLPPSGDAGGILAGTYPNPTGAVNAITGTMIALGSGGNGITGSNVNPASIGVATLTPSGTNYALPRTNSGATAVEWTTIQAMLQLAGVGFTSNAAALSAGSELLNAAHGLAATPRFVRAVAFVLAGQSDAGYVAADEVDVAGFLGSSGGSYYPAFSIGANATDTFICQNSASTQGNLYVNHKTTGVLTAITFAKWNVKLYCSI